MSIDVTGTQIDCYRGCLTSAKIIINGASNYCHDGSIMLRFIIITSSICISALIATVYYKYYHKDISAWVSPTWFNFCTRCSKAVSSRYSILDWNIDNYFIFHISYFILHIS